MFYHNIQPVENAEYEHSHRVGFHFVYNNVDEPNIALTCIILFTLPISDSSYCNNTRKQNTKKAVLIRVSSLMLCI